jgi:hypothetical protein
LKKTTIVVASPTPLPGTLGETVFSLP